MPQPQPAPIAAARPPTAAAGDPARDDAHDRDFPGAGNLEVMREAERYNAFLAGLVAALVPPGGRILDFGAGSGTITRRVAAATGSGPGAIMCVEPDPALRGRLAAEGFATAPALEATGPAEFDFAYTLNVLEHIEDDAAALRRLAGALRPGARLLVYVPAFRVLFSAMDEQVGHLRRYRRRELEALCRGSGLVVERSAYVDSLGFLASLVLRLAGPRSARLDPRMVRLYDRAVFPVSRAIDRVTGPFVGKNVVLVAARPAS